LIRDAAYESLLRSKRRQYHGQIAAALQKSFPEIVNANPELIAVHYTDAGLVEQAVASWQRAGQRALERSANQEAIRHLTKGLELLSILPETPEHLQQELLLRATLGPAVMLAKGFASLEAQDVYSRARLLCQQVSDAQLKSQPIDEVFDRVSNRGEHLQLRCGVLQLCGSIRATSAPSAN
jgi:predicted ATPase